jgi:hypothetical protein
MESFFKKGKISPLFPTEGIGGVSREVHLIEFKGKKYALRKCKTKDRADLFEKISKRFEKYGFVPKFIGRHKNNLFFEYLEGRDLSYKDTKYAEEIGKICGIVHREKTMKGKRCDYKSKFYIRLKFLLDNKVIDKNRYDLSAKKFEELNKKIKPKYGFDIGDLSTDNFRISNGKIYYVDLEGINVNRVLGTGFGKAFLMWFKTDNQRRNFLKGYNSVFLSKYLTKEYLDFIYLLFFASNTASKVKNNFDYSKNIRSWDLFLKGKLK